LKKNTPGKDNKKDARRLNEKELFKKLIFLNNSFYGMKVFN
jgi:hypothetical protein